MEVKVTFEDFDLQTEVEKAVYDEIRRIAGIEVHTLFKDSHIDYVSLNERVNNQIQTRINQILCSKSDKIEELIGKSVEKAVQKELDGIIKTKVAKIMSPYINILKEQKKEIDNAQSELDKKIKLSAELEAPAQKLGYSDEAL